MRREQATEQLAYLEAISAYQGLSKLYKTYLLGLGTRSIRPQVENRLYSVPDYLVGKKVTVKSYVDVVKIYANAHFDCEHKKKDGDNEISIAIKTKELIAGYKNLCVGGRLS